MSELKNPMKEVRVEKVVLNIGIGESGNKLERAKNLLEKLTDNQAVVTQSKSRNTFGTSEGRDIGVMVTLRGSDAKKFLERAFEVKDNKIKSRSVHSNGFSFGIGEHIDLPGIKYEPDIGIFGMDVVVSLKRPGYRVKKRKISKGLGDDHKIGKEEAEDFIKDEFNVDVT